jgi:hypothetical protein
MMLVPPLLCECVDHARSGTRRRASVPGEQDGAQQRHVPCAPSQTSVEVPVEHVSAAVDTLRRWPPPLARAASPASTAAPTPTAVGVPRSTCRWMCCDGWRSRPSGVSVANVSPRRRRQALHGLRPSRGDGLRPPITGQRGLAPATPTRSGWRAQISLTDSVRRVLGVPWGDWDGRHWEASHPILMGAPTRRSRTAATVRRRCPPAGGCDQGNPARPLRWTPSRSLRLAALGAFRQRNALANRCHRIHPPEDSSMLARLIAALTCCHVCRRRGVPTELRTVRLCVRCANRAFAQVRVWQP